MSTAIRLPIMPAHAIPLPSQITCCYNVGHTCVTITCIPASIQMEVVPSFWKGLSCIVLSVGEQADAKARIAGVWI